MRNLYIFTCTAPLDELLDLTSNILWIEGMQKAPVFPEPVRPRANRSLPSMTSGMALSWMRVGFTQPSFAMAFRILSSKPISWNGNTFFFSSSSMSGDDILQRNE